MGFKKFVLVTAILATPSAMAASITCRIAVELDGKALDPYVVTLPLTSNAEGCEKTVVYTVPGTSLDLSMHGHGNCSPAPGFCPNASASVDGIEGHDRATGNYSKAYGGCDKVSESMFYQTIIPGTPRKNVVVGCELKN